MPLSADLVVVGGGPGGSAAAEHAKRTRPDMEVILLEKRDAPHGTCAGGAGFPWFEDLDLDLPSHLIEAEINEVRISGPDKSASIHADDLDVSPVGWTIDRPRWDDWLLKRAEAEGAWVMRNTRFVEIARHNGSWIVSAENADGAFKISAPYVVDASGPGAVVAKQLGLEIDEDDRDVHVGYQETIPLETDLPHDRMDLWFKAAPEFEGDWAVPTGYVWSFPSSHTDYFDSGNPTKQGRYTRLGVGVDRNQNQSTEYNGPGCLAKFKNHFPEFDKDPLSTNGGLIPTGKPLETSFNGVFCVGDAGRHVSAVHGGGVYFARHAGRAAGITAALGEGDNAFDQRWREPIGWTLKLHYAIKGLIYGLDNAEIDALVDLLKGFDVRSPDPQKEIPRAAKAVVKHPKLGGKAAVQAFKSMVS